jgi:hypothetical protein
MKLYTEEQVMKAYNNGIQDEYNGMYKEDIVALKLTPIELPDNDEDAGKITLYISGIREESKAVYIVAGAMKYNEWIRSKILNQNK